jgi:hypothetical protein
MNIRDMQGIWPWDGPLGRTVRAGDEKVVLLEVEQFDGHGKQGKIESVPLLQKGEFLDKTGNDTFVFDIRDLAARKMKERIDGGVRIYLGKDLQDLLASSSTCQPIMNKSNIGTLH